MLIACGASDSSTEPATGAARDGSPTGDEATTQGSRSFLIPGGDNSVQNFGAEAGGAERGAASATLAAYLRARARDEWARECGSLAKATLAPLEHLASSAPRLKGRDCGQLLKSLEAGVPPSARADTMRGNVASLRIEGDRGFALYHGAAGVDYFMPMAREGGEWKVASLVPDEFP